MELVCALLTALFLMLFMLHYHYSSAARAREAGGRLLVEVKAGRQQIRLVRRFQFLLLFPQSIVLGAALFPSICLNRHIRSFPEDVLIGVAVYALLQTTLMSRWSVVSLELREHGVVRCGLLGLFTPWSSLRDCRWCDKWLGQRYADYRSTLFIERGNRAAEEVAAVSTAVASFLPVYDPDGSLIARPGSAKQVASADSTSSADYSIFQFSLQSLLLFVIVVSCAASCYGIHYRRTRLQQAAVAQFDKCRPRLFDGGGRVWSLDFSECAVKPNDGDLVYIEPLSGLEYLNLEGSNITDAGLNHIYPLKHLRSVTLQNTKVTRKGVEGLKQNLPNTTVYWHPPRNPPAPPPTDRK